MENIFQNHAHSGKFFPKMRILYLLMENNFSNTLPEILFGSSSPSISKQISRLEKEGIINKIAPRLYTSNLTEKPETVVRRHLFSILGNLYPNSLLSHRSALEFKPTATGQIFLSYSYTKKIYLPGITIRFLKGPDPIEGDRIITEKLHVSQFERALLENLQISRKWGPDSKTLTIEQVEHKLDEIVRVNGEDELNKIRDKAREIAAALEMENEFERLNKMIAELLSTKPVDILTSPLATARAFGQPYDPLRYELFQSLYKSLKKTPIKKFDDLNRAPQSFRNFAFYESYFSNFIEGTEFELEVAKEIVNSQTPMATRTEDSHDILGTFKIVSDINEMTIVPESPGHFLDLLKRRHKILMSARPNVGPGRFKQLVNRAGNTTFVLPNLVKGTLIKSFDFYTALDKPFQRAAYLMFVVSEVHPFLDGNGRIARVMMNAELVHSKQSRIIIPTVYRDDYILALRKLTRKKEASAYIKMLSRIHQYSADIAGNMDVMERKLKKTNAFKEHQEAKLSLNF